MKRSWCLRGLKAGVWGGLQAVMLVSLLSGCDTIDGVFGGGGSNATPQPVAGPAAQSTAPAPGQPGAQPSQPETYPNLGTVPTQAPTTSTSAQRQQLTSGLVADNQNASYSEQAVTAQQSAEPAPAPTPAPAPSGNAAATGSAPAAEPAAQSSVSQNTTN